MEEPYKIASAIFDNMKPGSMIKVSDFAAKNPDLFIQMAKQYIDNGGMIGFLFNYSVIQKQHPIPESNSIAIIVDYKDEIK